MICDEALEAISAALDGELSQAERAKLSRHLLECPQCRALAEDLRVLTDILEDSEQAPPPELAASIRRAVAEEVKPSAAPKKRKVPYLRTVAAMLALCAGLGGIGLFAAGQKGGMSGGAAAGNAAPAVSFKSSPEMADGAFGGAADEAMDYSVSGECEPGAPHSMEMNEPPMPAPSSAPAPAEGNADSGSDGSSDYDSAPQASISSGAVGGASLSPSASEVPEAASVTPEEALELAFEYIGGYEAYPEAQLRVDNFGGYDAPVYYLETVETDSGTWEYRLDYDSLSSGENYLFHLYYELVSGGADDVGHTATMNWIEVSVDGGSVVPMF